MSVVLFVPHRKTTSLGENGGWGAGLWLNSRRKGACLPTVCLKTRKSLESARGHLEQFEVWSSGLFNVSSNELHDETESTLINFIDDTQLRLEGHLGGSD